VAARPLADRDHLKTAFAPELERQGTVRDAGEVTGRPHAPLVYRWS